MATVNDNSETRSPASVLRVVVGNPYGPDGETAVLLSPSGELVVEHRADEDKSTFEGRLSAEEVEELLTPLDQTAIWAESLSERTGIPDEARYVFEVSDEIQAARRITIWEGDAETHRVFGPLLRRLRSAVADTAGKDVLL